MSRKTIPGLDLAVQNIFCIGRNYAEHAHELGNPVPKEPLVFLKPTGSVCYNNEIISLPFQSKDVHHEVELVVAIAKKGKDIPVDEALGYVAGYGVGIDFTARDIQEEAKLKGKPWSIAKGFDGFAPISDFVSSSEVPDPQNLDIELTVNGESRQSDNTKNMLFPVYELIVFLSSIFTLQPGDLIFTGTPSGVSAIQSGDSLNATLGDDLTKLSVFIA